MPGGSISNARNGGQQGVRRLHFCCAFLLLDGCLNPGNLLVQPSDMRLQRALDRLVLTVFQGISFPLPLLASWLTARESLASWLLFWLSKGLIRLHLQRSGLFLNKLGIHLVRFCSIPFALSEALTLFAWARCTGSPAFCKVEAKAVS